MLKEKIISAGSRMLLKVKKYSPEILVAGGIMMGAAALYSAIKGTIKYKDCIEPSYAEVKEDFEEGRISEEEYKEEKKDIVKEIIKAYLPTAGFSVLSLGLILASHGIVRKREAGAMAAYEALNKAYNALRSEKEEVTEDIPDVTEENPNATGTVLPVLSNPYARVFEEGASDAWQPSKGYNEMFLRQMETWCNEQLDIQGHLFVNDIYDGLRLPRTSAGAVAGYLKEDGVRVDFGIFKPSDKLNPRVRAFLDPLDPENNVVINLNVPGLIWDRI